MVDIIRIWKGTVGAALEIISGEDLVTGVSAVALYVQKPSGAIDTWTPDSITSTTLTNCIINYATNTDDLDEGGVYVIQPKVTRTDGSIWYLEPVMWKIWDDYEVPGAG
jgi:hypothetical protein